MNWHYVEQGQQIGPVSDEQFVQLVQEGRINDDTLVWHDGMPNWSPYREIKAGAPAPPPPGFTPAAPVYSPDAGEVVCAECGRLFPVAETIRFRSVYVCAGCKPLLMQKLAEGARVDIPGEFAYARIITRFAAVFLDGLILMVVNYSVGFIIGLIVVGSSRGASSAFMVAQLLGFIVNMAIAATYEGVLIGKYGATLGKMACKIKVVTADGAPVGYGRAFGRYFAKLLSSFTCMIGYIIALFDDQKRALHDHICNTRVIIK